MVQTSDQAVEHVQGWWVKSRRLEASSCRCIQSLLIGTQMKGRGAWHVSWCHACVTYVVCLYLDLEQATSSHARTPARAHSAGYGTNIAWSGGILWSCCGPMSTRCTLSRGRDRRDKRQLRHAGTRTRREGESRQKGREAGG
jgi:hypothetical protein